MTPTPDMLDTLQAFKDGKRSAKTTMDILIMRIHQQWTIGEYGRGELDERHTQEAMAASRAGAVLRAADEHRAHPTLLSCWPTEPRG